MKSNCPECGAALKDEDLDIQANTSKCSACGAEFKVTDLMGLEKEVTDADAVSSEKAEQEEDEGKKETEQEDVNLEVDEANAGPITEPAKMTTTESSDELKIQWRWNQGGGNMAGLVIVLIWNIFVGSGFYFAIKFADWMLMVCLIPFLGFGLMFIYAILTSVINQTQITVSVDEVKVWNGPLPASGNLSVPSPSITRVDAHNDPARNDANLNSGRGSKTTVYCRVSVMTADGERKDLVKGLKSYNDARYVASKIRTFLAL